MLHSAFDQIDANDVHVQYDKLLDSVYPQPRSKPHLDAAEMRS